MKTLLVVDDVTEWMNVLKGVEIVQSDHYLTDSRYEARQYKVFNLCRSYSYQTAGYYVSLLGSARGQKIVPDISTMLDMQAKHFLKLRSDDIDELIQKSLADLKADEFDLSIYFGKNTAKRYEKLAYELHHHFHAPLIRAVFKRKDKWRLHKIGPIGLKDVPSSHIETLAQYAEEYFKKRMTHKKVKAARFDMAILVNPSDPQPPSNEKALKEFIKAANQLEIDVELITKSDFHRLQEFDSLFIRETTSVNHHTFRFAHQAASLGLVVIDDPLSILRCTNKVYLADLFDRQKIDAPKTILIHRKNFKEKAKLISLPAVLKSPDSAFSKGVVKVETPEALLQNLEVLLEDSDMVLAQEWLPTKYDWRIGVLDKQPLYACKYYMARDHWQIYKQEQGGGFQDGASETLALEDAPADVVDLAVRCTNLVGNGLYGVDIKEKDGKLYVIEINDNPSIDAGCEDLVMKKELYETIMRTFLNRMERNAMGNN
jgi:glutathione synthase/RimK-type ligase-like ATP-grasp enzyme